MYKVDTVSFDIDGLGLAGVGCSLPGENVENIEESIGEVAISIQTRTNNYL